MLRFTDTGKALIPQVLEQGHLLARFLQKRNVSFNTYFAKTGTIYFTLKVGQETLKIRVSDHQEHDKTSDINHNAFEESFLALARKLKF